MVILEQIKTEGHAGDGDIIMKKSNDGGDTWRIPVDLTSTYKEHGENLDRTASDHGIEIDISNLYKGKLIVPLTYGEDSVEVAYSDD